jgi:hypothetical protein
MKNFIKRRGLVFVGVVCVVLFGVIAPGIASAHYWDPFRIAPIYSHPGGKTYGEWAAEWWQWVFGLPPGVNPAMDSNGEFCAVGQRGDVWFLAGSFGAEAVRKCTIPRGKALFFPLINTFYGAFLSDPPETTTKEFIREQVDCGIPSELVVEIDGFTVKNPFKYLEKSPFFDVKLPEDNILGVGEDVIPQLLLCPSADKGYYIFLEPLSPGEHKIHWKATWTCPSGDSSQDITYDLTILQPCLFGKCGPWTWSDDR